MNSPYDPEKQIEALLRDRLGNHFGGGALGMRRSSHTDDANIFIGEDFDWRRFGIRGPRDGQIDVSEFWQNREGE